MKNKGIAFIVLLVLLVTLAAFVSCKNEPEGPAVATEAEAKVLLEEMDYVSDLLNKAKPVSASLTYTKGEYTLVIQTEAESTTYSLNGEDIKAEVAWEWMDLEALDSMTEQYSGKVPVGDKEIEIEGKVSESGNAGVYSLVYGGKAFNASFVRKEVSEGNYEYSAVINGKIIPADILKEYIEGTSEEAPEAEAE